MNLQYIFNDPEMQARIDRLRDLTILLEQRHEADADIEIAIQKHVERGNDLLELVIQNQEHIADIRNRAQIVLDDFTSLFRDQEIPTG